MIMYDVGDVDDDNDDTLERVVLLHLTMKKIEARMDRAQSYYIVVLTVFHIGKKK